MDVRAETQRQMTTAVGLNGLEWTALVLTLIGAINWGLVGLFNFDLVAAIFGDMSALSRLIYVLVGVSAVYLAFLSPRLGKRRP